MRDLENVPGSAASLPSRYSDSTERFASTSLSISVHQQNIWRDDFERVVRVDVLPRLARALSARTPQVSPTPDFPAEQIEAFTRSLLQPGVEPATAFLDKLVRGGANRADIAYGLLRDAARRLGARWESDECDFIQVSIGVDKLRLLLRDLAPAAPVGPRARKRAGDILLSPAPGETHDFGVEMVASWFRSRGWNAVVARESEGLREISRGHFDLVGFSISCLRHVERMPAAIAAARRASFNPEIRVLVGGSLFVERPDLARSMGADAFASSAADALYEAHNLLHGHMNV